MASVLYIGNRYISDLQELREVFTKDIPSVNDKKRKESLYREINTLFHDNVIQEWLSNGDKEEQQIAQKLNAINKNDDVTKINRAIGEAITQKKIVIDRHLPDYLQLVEKRCSVNGKEAISFESCIEHSTKEELTLVVTYIFKCVKAETERFDFLLMLGGEQVDTQTVNVAEYIEGEECTLSFKPFKIPALTKKVTIYLIEDKKIVCQSELIGDDSLTFCIKGKNANPVSIKMIKVEGGSFKMASNYKVHLDDYYIGEVPVTQELWEAVMHGQSKIDKDPSHFKNPQKPVECVSHDWICQSGGFLKRLNKLLEGKLPRGKKFVLPTEAQWEFAARGGNESAGYQYSGSNELEKVAWYRDNSGRETHLVKQLDPNELGLYDMSGNVYEWCSDWYGSYSGSEQTNPKGPSSGTDRVCRGGSWDDDARYCRSSNRFCNTPGYRSYRLGLRLCLSE